MPQSPNPEPYAILVADMIGYSQRLATHPKDTHAAFKVHLDRIFVPSVGDHAGRVVKTTGDGIVAIFPDSDQADQCARVIQSQLAGQEDSPAPIRYRIAIHYGTIVIEQHDVFGLDVNIAIHLQQLAPEAGVCVSGALFARLPQPNQQHYQFVGHRYLKNIPAPITIYRDAAARTEGGPQSHRLATSRRNFLTPPPRLGLAVYRAFAETALSQALAEMTQDSITHGLSCFKEMFSIAPLGMEFTKAAAKQERFRESLSSELACEYLFHGSCFVAPNTLTLTSHLESLVRRELIWSGKLKVDLNEIEVLDDLTASEIIAPVVLHLERTEAETWDTRLHSDDDIRFREAMRLTERGTLETLDQARHIFFRDHQPSRRDRQRLHRHGPCRAQSWDPSGRRQVRRVARACPDLCQEGGRGRRYESPRPCRVRDARDVLQASEQRCRVLSACVAPEPLRSPDSSRLGGLPRESGPGG